MLRHKRLLIGLGVAILLVSILAAGNAFAQTPTPQAKPGATNVYQSFLDKLAKSLGIEREALGKALVTARDQMLDEAVEKGALTEKQAEKIREIDKNGDRWPGFMGQIAAHRAKNRIEAQVKLAAGNATVEALAQITGKTVEQVKEELRASKNLKKFLDDNQITREQLNEAVAKITEQKLAQAVKDGKLTQEQADRILERLKKGPPKVLQQRNRNLGPLKLRPAPNS